MKMKLFALSAFALLASACAPTANETFGPFLTQARTQGLPVLVYAYGVPGEITAGGNKSAVPVYIQFVVTSDKPIRNIRFTLIGYTTRGIAVQSKHGLGIALTLIGPGPFNPGKNYEVNSFHSSPAGFPGDEVACIRLARMQILYANGRSRSYAAEGLNPLLLPPLRKGCSDKGPPVNLVDGGG